MLLRRTVVGLAWLGLVWLPVLLFMAVSRTGLAFLWFGLVFSYHLSIGHLLGGAAYDAGAALYIAAIILVLGHLVGGARRKLLTALLSLALLPVIIILGIIVFFMLVAAPGL